MKNVFKKFSVAMMAVLSATATNAAQLPFDVEAPSWTMLAECTTEGGVNIRQQPSTTAARLVYDENNMDMEDWSADGAFWSKATPTGTIHPFTFDYSAPIIMEKNGWLQLYGIGPNGTSGWVSAKYCKKTPIKPFTGSDYDRFIEHNGQKYVITIEFNEMTREVKFYVGKMAKGFIVYPYSYTPKNGYDYSKNGKTYLENDCLYFPNNSEGYMPPMPDPKKLSDNSINYLIRKATPMSRPWIQYGE